MIVQPGDHQSENFSVQAFETPLHHILRSEYDALTISNQASITHFNPHDPDAFEELQMRTSYPEYEDQEPTVSDAFAAAMEQKLGLKFVPKEVKPDGVMFEAHYSYQQAEQIRMLVRPDGVTIPVLIRTNQYDENYGIETAELLSYKVAVQRVKYFKAEQRKADDAYRLHSELGFDADMVEQAGWDADDIKTILAISDEIHATETRLPELDSECLEDLRLRLTRSLLPAVKIMPKRRARRVTELSQGYQREFDRLTSIHGVDGNVMLKERLLRLQLLNEQLELRQRTARIGAIAIGTMMTTGASATGYATGFYWQHVMPHFSSLSVGILGGVASLAWSVANTKNILKRENNNRDGFNYTAPSNTLESQLAHETRLADWYLARSKQY